MRKLAVLLLMALCLLPCACAEEFLTFETEYLVMDIPKDWTRVERDGHTYFYADASGTDDNGLLIITEDESTPYADALAPRAYQVYLDWFNSQSQISDLHMESVKICNQDAAYYSMTIKSIPFHVGVYVIPSKGYTIIILYAHPKENQNAKKELLAVLNTIRHKGSVSAEAKQEEQPTPNPGAQPTAPSRAEEIDLTKMTTMELTGLRDRINAELKENHAVSWTDKNDITNILESFIEETFNVASYRISVNNLDVINDWGVYSATCQYSFRDKNNEKHSGDMVAQLKRGAREFEPIYIEIDGSMMLDSRNAVGAADNDKQTKPTKQPLDQMEPEEPQLPLPVTSLQFGELLDVTVNEIDNIIIIKAKIKPSFSNKTTISQNYHNVLYLINLFGIDQYNQLQYWAVADMTDGTEAKVVAFDVSQSVMLMLRNGRIAATQLGDYADNLWIHPSLR